MSLRYYMDAHIPKAISSQLLSRGVDVLTSQDDGTQELPDPDLLDWASELGRVLVTEDDDLLREAALRQNQGHPFPGVIYGHAMDISIGQFIADLELLARASRIEEWVSRVEYLPLK